MNDKTNDKDKVRLLPCPCCGGRAALSTYKKRIGTACRHTVIRQHAVCKVCGTQTRVFKALGRAAAAWNKRQPIGTDKKEAMDRLIAQDADLIDAPTQTDALKIARDAICGLLDITSEYNLDSEQAGRAYAALHEIGTALKEIPPPEGDGGQQRIAGGE